MRLDRELEAPHLDAELRRRGEPVLKPPHLTFSTAEAMERCDEILSGPPVLVKSTDPRLRAQERGVRFG